MENHIGAFNSLGLLSNKTCYKGAGLTDDDLARPIIGIADSFNESVAGHSHLRELTEAVKNGIYRAGGTPVEFGVIACCDGVADNHYGAHYVLPSRDNIADAIEIQARANRFDGIVMVGSCDKILPGMLMAAARLDIPAIIVPGGPTVSSGSFRDKKKINSTTISEAYGLYTKGEVTEKELQKLTSACTVSCGACQFMGTANTMGCFCEAIGMTLSGGALIPAPYIERKRMAFRSGEKILELVEKGITARQIMTWDAIENCIMTLMAVGGSTNAVIHMCALAHELGYDADKVMDAFDRISTEIPHIAKVSPASTEKDCEDLYKGGPGMREMYLTLKMLNGQGLAKTTALITDGRFSGTNNGCFVGHISPEAADGGPLALVRDGDQITIDVYEKRLELHVSDEELAKRKAEWKYTAPEIPDGYLRRYAKLVSSANKGAILE